MIIYINCEKCKKEFKKNPYNFVDLRKRLSGEGCGTMIIMTAENFLSELKNALDGSISPSSVNENIRYYEEYIDTEKMKGRTEEEIMGELGDPRLIARTIIDTSDVSDMRGSRRIYENGADTGSDYREEEERRNGARFVRVSGLKALAVMIGILLIFVVILFAAAFLVGSFIVAFWPAIIVAAVIWWILNPTKGQM